MVARALWCPCMHRFLLRTAPAVAHLVSSSSSSSLPCLSSLSRLVRCFLHTNTTHTHKTHAPSLFAAHRGKAQHNYSTQSANTVSNTKAYHTTHNGAGNTNVQQHSGGDNYSVGIGTASHGDISIAIIITVTVVGYRWTTTARTTSTSTSNATTGACADTTTSATTTSTATTAATATT